MCGFFSIKLPGKCIQDAIQYFNIHISFYMEMYYSIKIQCSVFISLCILFSKSWGKMFNPMVPYFVIWKKSTFYA